MCAESKAKYDGGKHTAMNVVSNGGDRIVYTMTSEPGIVRVFYPVPGRPHDVVEFERF